mgnify:CR=1 FL=1
MLRRLWKYGREDSLIRDSFILFSASSLVNLGAFLFHFIMGRFLGPTNYGMLGTLLAIVYIINVPINVIQTIITKFVSQYHTNKEENNINYLMRRSLRKCAIIGVISLLVVLVISPLIANFLHITAVSIIILSPVILFSVILPIIRGNLQGLQKFKLLGLNLITEIAVKLLLGIILVYLGFKVYGAITAIVLSFLFPILIGLISIRKYISKKSTKEFNHKQIYAYSYPVLIALTLMSLLITIDVFLVKHLFDEFSAGLYVAASVLGKIIFFGTFAISQVMFPKSVEKFTLNKSTSNVLKKSLLLISVLAVPITACYFLFPKIIIKILFGYE